MIIDREGNVVTITQERGNVKELVKNITAVQPKYKSNNIIVNLSSLGKLSEMNIVEFLQVSNTHRLGKQSFVIVSSKINIEETPDEIIIVPTTQEAHDIIEMEEMERDLGF